MLPCWLLSPQRPLRKLTALHVDAVAAGAGTPGRGVHTICRRHCATPGRCRSSLGCHAGCRRLVELKRCCCPPAGLLLVQRRTAVLWRRHTPEMGGPPTVLVAAAHSALLSASQMIQIAAVAARHVNSLAPRFDGLITKRQRHTSHTSAWIGDVTLYCPSASLVNMDQPLMCKTLLIVMYDAQSRSAAPCMQG